MANRPHAQRCQGVSGEEAAGAGRSRSHAWHCEEGVLYTVYTSGPHISRCAFSYSGETGVHVAKRWHPGVQGGRNTWFPGSLERTRNTISRRRLVYTRFSGGGQPYLRTIFECVHIVVVLRSFLHQNKKRIRPTQPQDAVRKR